MEVDWAFAWEVLPLLLKASLTTLQATFFGFILALVFGLLLALIRRSSNRVISWPVGWFIEFVRSTPLLVQLFFVYFLLPEYGLRLPALTTGILCLGLHYSAYTSEVYRAGLNSIPKGQWEAATALNFRPLHVYSRIIIPQAIPPVVPALGNYLVAMFKDTPLLSAIAVVELLQRAKIIGSETFRYLEPVTMVGLFFLAMSLGASALIRRVEWRLRLSTRILKETQAEVK